MTHRPRRSEQYAEQIDFLKELFEDIRRKNMRKDDNNNTVSSNM